MEENLSNPNEFLYQSTGFYNALGNSFYIKLQIVETNELHSIPNIWNFQISYEASDLEILRHFLYHSIFEQPQEGELFFKTNGELDNAIVIYKANYYRKLRNQMQDIFKNGSFNKDTRWYSIYFSLTSTELVKGYKDFKIFR